LRSKRFHLYPDATIRFLEETDGVSIHGVAPYKARTRRLHRELPNSGTTACNHQAIATSTTALGGAMLAAFVRIPLQKTIDGGFVRGL
jgi:hypothetical protein